MDLQSLEKKLIYLKGVQAGILQGTNPNVSKYKIQIDYEVASLEKEVQKLNNKQNLQNNIQNNIKINNSYKHNIISKKEIEENISEEHNIEETNLKNEDIEEIDDMNISKMKFLEVSKNINHLKDKVFQNNNFIKLLNRNKTYQNTMKVQNILKQNNQIQLQIQQNQQLYDVLNLKINNYSLYQKLYHSNLSNNNLNKQNIHLENNKEVIKPKSILKSKKDNSNSTSNSNHLNFDGKKHIQINIEKNEIKEIPPNENKKNIFLQKKINNNIKQNNIQSNVQSNVQNNLAFQNKKPEIKIEESDEDLMKEFQNTIGSLQKLLI